MDRHLHELDGSSLPDALQELANRGMNIMSSQHVNMKAGKVIEVVATNAEPPSGNIIDKATKEALKTDRPKLSVREALRLKLSAGMHVI